jgi:hypothetical protein
MGAVRVNFDLRILQPYITGALVIATIALLRFLMRRGKPAIHAGKQSITFSRSIGWIGIVLGVGMLAGGIALLIYGRRDWPIYVWAIMGLLLTMAIAPSLTANAAVAWSEESIEGPLHRFRVPTLRKRVRIAWPDIRRAGTTWDQYWYVESEDGRRVHWGAVPQGKCRPCSSASGEAAGSRAAGQYAIAPLHGGIVEGNEPFQLDTKCRHGWCSIGAHRLDSKARLGVSAG